MQTEKLRLSFHGIRVQAHVYCPEGEIMHRAFFVSSPFGDPASWQKLIQLLVKNGCLCVSADLPGFGANPVSPDVPQDNSTRAQILWGILDEVEARRSEEQMKWHLVGHGSGCAAVMHMALYQPDSTLSRVLLNPVMDRLLASPIHAVLSSKNADGLLNALNKRYIQNTAGFKRLLNRLYGHMPSEARIAHLQKMLLRKGTAATLARHMREGYRSSDGVYSVETPVMLIWGANDRIFGGQIPSHILKKLPNAEKHLIKCAHMSMETLPDAVCDYLRGWFRFSEGREKSVTKPTR